MSDNSSKLLKQRLQRVHVAVGISFSLFMYVAVFFGIFAILLPYINTWEKPSRHFQAADIKEINYSAMIDPVISDPEFPRNNIVIQLPGYRGDPALKIRHRFTQAVVFNPNTMERVKDEKDISELAWFLNSMHYGRPLKTFGYVLFGFVAVGVMFLTIGGLIQVYIIKYKNKGKNQQSKFSKWHRKIFTWIFAPFIIVTLTGALMNIGYTGSAPMAYISSQGETHQIGRLIRPVLNPDRQKIEKKGDTVQMLPINELIKKAQQINPDVNFHKIKLINWKDSSAQVELEGYNPKMPFLNGIYNDPTVILSGVDGSLIENIKVLDAHWSKLFVDSMYFLHLLFGVDVFTRFFIAILMAICGLAIGFGVMLWLEKRAKRYEHKIPFYHWFGKLSLAVMIGVIPATGLIFLLQWILPFDMQDRLVWQKGLFFVFWLATLTWAFYRICSYQATKEFLFIGALFFIFTPFMHFYSVGFTPFDLYTLGMNTILNVDIALFLFGLVLMLLAYKLPNNRTEAKKFFKAKI
ncbi:ABC transporter permease [Malaciobacter halophilus]|uniref:ABC transporter permease n=1 Tax=Malaciobacter halophilus TaxID=197482 RepID=A0A2N1J653_9BACT|nr:PepSY-associated TM helix domain-containing protein [Malaciobacter halophilus]AXH08809.1 PepSY domain-containing membrane protein [Malaciobacter halophilus]PKI82040.1 ABC transporter permease [Malaciobacter halophilus]